MPANIEHVRLHFQPDVVFTSEQTANYLGIDIKKADELLSGPEAYQIIQTCLKEAIEKGLDEGIRLLARQKFPSIMDRGPIRQDCVVELPALPNLVTESKL